MKTPLAWLNLLHNRTRSLVAVAGVAFAVVLMLMQLGFYGAVRLSATNIYDALDFDLLVVSRHYRILSSPGDFPEHRLSMARGDADVRATTGVQIGLQGWLNHAVEPVTRRGLLVLAVRPGDGAFQLADVRNSELKLAETGGALFDLRSRPDFGPREVGWQSEIGAQRVRIVGNFTLGAGFCADGAVIVGDNTFGRIFPWRASQQTNLGLVKLRDGADPVEVANRLRARLPEDVQVKTRAQALGDEQRHWILKTAVGVIFGLGVLVALAVGTGIVYQVLSSDIANRLPEFATLKAMGYGQAYLTRTVLLQASALAVGGFIPGWIASVGLFELTRREAFVPMRLSTTLALSVFALSVTMCIVSGLLALRKVAQADPADLF